MRSVNSRTARGLIPGFTLVEILITVAVLGILAAIAIPAYQQYVKRGKSAVAGSCLMQVAGRMENYFSSQFTYTTDLTAIGLVPVAAGSGYNTCDGNDYTVTATTVGACSIKQCYQLVATPPGVASGGEGSLRLTVDASQTSLGARLLKENKASSAWVPGWPE